MMQKFFIPVDVFKTDGSCKRKMYDVMAETRDDAAREALAIAREEWADAKLARVLDNATGSLKDACAALDRAAEEKGGDISVEDALEAMGGVLYGDEELF